jgi:hypothetical protein
MRARFCTISLPTQAAYESRLGRALIMLIFLASFCMSHNFQLHNFIMQLQRVLAKRRVPFFFSVDLAAETNPQLRAWNEEFVFA